MAQYQVDAHAAGDEIRCLNAFAKPQHIDFGAITVVFIDDVLPVTQIEQVKVTARATVQDIIAGTAFQQVSTCAGGNDIVARAPSNDLRLRTADTGQHIVTVSPLQVEQARGEC